MRWTALCATNTNNANKTRVLLQTNGGKDEQNIVFICIFTLNVSNIYFNDDI